MVPPAAPGQADQQAVGSAPAGQRGRAKPSTPPEPETWAEPSYQPEPETWAEPSDQPEPETWAEPSVLPEPETRIEPVVPQEPVTPAEPPAPPEPELMLLVTSGPNVGETFVLHRRELVIGREEGSDIRLDDLTVSHNHALVRARGDVATIEDLRSTNGTTVNGTPISRPVPIVLGDVITTGAVEFVVERHGAG
jgi:pSer/pThr/pTyr-binding forkhead associated (FHA) protein